MATTKPKRKRIREQIEPVVVVVRLTVRQRCFYLFCALLLLIVAVPFLEGSTGGRLVLNGISLLVLISGSAAIGRGRLRLALGLLLGAPAAALQIATLLFEQTNLLVVSWGFSAAFYLLVVGYLLSYALRREVLTMDKLLRSGGGLHHGRGALDLLLRNPPGGPSRRLDDERHADCLRNDQHPDVLQCGDADFHRHERHPAGAPDRTHAVLARDDRRRAVHRCADCAPRGHLSARQKVERARGPVQEKPPQSALKYFRVQ